MRDDERDRERESAAAFVQVWRESREGKTRDEAEEMISFMLENKEPVVRRNCATGG